jgi:hypothetical protein
MYSAIGSIECEYEYRSINFFKTLILHLATAYTLLGLLLERNLSIIGPVNNEDKIRNLR